MSDLLPESTDGWAFFLDIDGTLIDIAPTPDAVIVPPDLPVMLGRLCEQAGGALALLTGRSIATVDRLFAPVRLPVGAIHGTEIRFPGGEVVSPPSVPALAGIRQRLTDFVAAHPGALLEDKGSAVAVHFRADPALHGTVEREILAAAEAAGGGLVVQPGKMVFEVRPAGTGKGQALAAFMAHAAFAGRRPLAIGDDVTDETMFAAALRLGGCALRVGPAGAASVATVKFEDPAAVRRWIAGIIRQ